MGKGGRFFCIFTPYALTIAALICLIIVGLGSTDNGTDSLRDLHFFRIDLQNLTTSTTAQTTVENALDDLNITVDDGDIKTALEEVQKYFKIQDFYNIGVWGYCDGNITSKDDYEISNCSKPKAEFWFNPDEVWNLDTLGLDNAIPSDLQKSLKVYKKVSKWMFVAYIVAFAATALELLIGITAIFSRWGSCVTTLVSITAFLFTAAASATSTAMFAVITGVINEKLKKYGVVGSMGKHIYVATWLAVAFSLGAALFWALSSCCCSGRSPYSHRDRGVRGVMAEKAPYTYEPINSPYSSPQPGYTAPPMQHPHPQDPQRAATSYEPFRHV
ncbi:hypothetical protein P175DRAFT_0516440 [Aspergillus ochraceoroseus IBT 24754]|uniref:Integral membrane protein n=1 Tax=Aspergillus ochraceoroseus IBT 24754 TaxID=1392256 RepID=A0A2T5LX38_9EURO|nr:uncharacterized protein P175DRAFT_0516440 [Aspergillus ochraceoroseus IBT 24754]PTU20803.1 hypothetical protein P175DRAFT_0516440 [Aspergillus ochraceoroseus IBT 24754]